MVVNFLHHNFAEIPPLFINGTKIERVASHRLLGVQIFDDLSWNTHFVNVIKKATKRLFAISALRNSGLPSADHTRVYCTIIRPILEYASPEYLVDSLESIQKKVLHHPHLPYSDALLSAK